MNKVMNNFKKQGNSIVIQSVNENVIVLTHLKIQKGQFLMPFFFIRKLCLIINHLIKKNLKFYNVLYLSNELF